jgi:hypothetical protein
MGPLITAFNEGAAAVEAGTQRMATAQSAAAATINAGQAEMATGAASLAVRLSAEGLSASDVASALRNLGYTATEAAAATQGLSAAEAEAATGADREAVSHTENAAAIGREVSARQAATASIGAVEGRTLGANRAAATFLSTTLGLGPALQAAFPVIGAIALIDVLAQIPKAIERMEDALAGWDREAQEIFQRNVTEAGHALDAYEALALRQAESAGAGLKGVPRFDEEIKGLGDFQQKLAQAQGTANALVESLHDAGKITEQYSSTPYGPVEIVSSSFRSADVRAQVEKQIQQFNEEAAAAAKAAHTNIPAPITIDWAASDASVREQLDKLTQDVRKRQEQMERAQEQATQSITENTARRAEAHAQAEAEAARKSMEARNKELESFKLDEQLKTAELVRDDEARVAIERETVAKAKQLYGEASDQFKRAKLDEIRVADEVEKAKQQSARAEFEYEKSQQEQFAKQQDEIIKEMTKVQLDRLKGMAEASRTIQAEAERHNQATLELEAQRVQNEYQLGQISGQQELAALRAIHAQEHAETLRFLEEQKAAAQRLPDADPNKVAEIAKIDAQIEQENDRHNARMMADDQRTATLRQNLWRSFTTDFNQGMGQIVSASIAGGRNVQQAIGNALEGMLAHEAQFVVQWVLKKAEMWAMDAILGRASQTTTATTTIVSDAAVAAAGAYAATAAIPFIGPELAPAAALEAEASVLAFLAQASAREGFDVPDLGAGGMVTMLHSREMVLPEEHADTIRALPRLAGGDSGVQGGDAPHYHYHDHTTASSFNSDGLEDVLKRNPDRWGKHVRDLVRSGRLPRQL